MIRLSGDVTNNVIRSPGWSATGFVVVADAANVEPVGTVENNGLDVPLTTKVAVHGLVMVSRIFTNNAVAVHG
jgi:hypothetical protein